MAMTTTTASLTVPPVPELEARLRQAREEAATVKRLLKIRRDLDAAADAERRRAGVNAAAAGAAG
jgi:hypothetical protein